MKFTKLAAISAFAAASFSTAAMAQDMAVGATVYGPEGNAVGTVETISDTGITFDTGKHQVTLPAASFGKSDKGPTITVNQATINQMMDAEVAKREAARDALLVVGTEVHTADHQVLGNIKTVDGDVIVIEREAGPVTLQREHFSAMESMLMALFTMEQIEAALSAQAGQ